jgi:hypothetical protein
MRNSEKFVSASVVTTTSNISLGQAPDWAVSMTIYVNATAVSGTTPSLTPTINSSPDNVAFAPDIAGTAITAAGTQKLKLPANVSRFQQLACVVSGTTPSFTLDIWVEYRGL